MTPKQTRINNLIIALTLAATHHAKYPSHTTRIALFQAQEHMRKAALGPAYANVAPGKEGVLEVTPNPRSK